MGKISDIPIELSIVMPCLNEEQTVETCIGKAMDFLHKYHIPGEVIIADNGSTDRSIEIAVRAGAKVVSVEAKGYGNALRGGIEQAGGKYILMGDADDSYDFSRLELFVEKLREGYDLVMGNRFKGGVLPGAMPPLHRYVGNPVLSFIGQVFFRTGIGDFHCGLRGFSKEAYCRMNPKSEGMEFASEIVIKASLLGLRVAEVPTVLHPDGRNRKPHLRSWHDGWRHLKLLLMYCPRWLFLYPGFLLLTISLIAGFLLIPGAQVLGKVQFDIHTLYYMGIGSTLGIILLQFYLFSRIYGDRSGYYSLREIHRKIIRFLSIERSLIIGGVLLAGGIGGTVFAFYQWQQVHFGNLNPEHIFRIILPSGFAMINGILIILGNFFIRILQIK